MLLQRCITPKMLLRISDIKKVVRVWTVCSTKYREEEVN